MSLPAETIERRLLGKYFRAGFLGPALNLKTYCPVAVPGVDFNVEDAALTTPFTPDEVRGTAAVAGVGYVEMSLRELDSRDAGVGSGMAALAGGGEGMVSSLYTFSRLRFGIRVPAKADIARVELYAERLRELYLGLRVVHDGPPRLILRQDTERRPVVWADYDDGNWRRRDFDVYLRRWERRAHAGVQEVTL